MNFIDNYINNQFYNPRYHEKETAQSCINFISKIFNSLKNNTPITICGDYDVDGISSTTMLKEMIQDYAKFKKIKPNIDIYIPSREDGYGLSIDTFNKIVSTGNFVITLDNGTHKNFLNNIQEEHKNNIFIIDHHPNGDNKLDFVLNPNSDGTLIISTAYLLDYVYESLLKIDKDYAKQSDRYRYSDLVSMSLISDMADLNNYRVRHLIKKGLEKIQQKERLLFRQLFPRKDKQVTYNSVAFEINPRINSIGRLSKNPKDAVDILEFKEHSNRGLKAIEYLNSVNNLRKKLLSDFSDLALEDVKKRDLGKKNIIFYYNKDIPLGLNGLIAQRISEIYETPALVASNSKMKESIKASGRGFNIKYILNMFRDGDVFTYGGHNEALGAEIKDINLFHKIMERANSKNLYLNKEFNNITLDNKYNIDEYIKLSKEFSLKTDTIPFKQKFFLELEDAEASIKKKFKNNYCYLEIKDKNTHSIVNFLAKTNIAEEIVKQKEPFFVPLYAEYNGKKVSNDFTGDIILKKNLINSREHLLEEDLFLYR